MTEVLEKPATKKKPVAKRKKTAAPKKPITKKRTVVKKPTKPKTTRKRRPSKAQEKKHDKDVIKNAVGQTNVVDDALIDDLGAPVQTEDQLNIIREKSSLAVKILKWTEKAEDLLKERKAEYNELVKTEIPEKMLAIGLNSFSLKDGTEIKINDFMSGSLPKNPEKRKEAIEYLFDLEAGGLLKPSIKIQLAVGEEDVAKAALKTCRSLTRNKKKKQALLDAGVSEIEIEALKVIANRAEINHDVHHSTLAAFGREFVSNGKELDTRKLGLFGGKVAKINLPEDKRKGKK